MDRGKNQEYELKYKKIWNTTYAPIALILFVPVVIFGGLGIVLAWMKHQFNLVNMMSSTTKLYAILCFFAIPFIITVILMIKEMLYYNSLVDDGVILEGTIQNVYNNGFGKIQIEAAFSDDTVSRQYIYRQSNYKGWDFYKLRIFVKEDPHIKILVKRNNYENGYILFDEYCRKKDWKSLYNKEPVFNSWRGQYKGNSKLKEMSENELQIPGAIMVKGKLLKESIKTQMDTRSTIILYADVNYFDSEKGEVLIFKGKYVGRPMVYWDIKRSKEDIYVQVTYNPEDNRHYKVYLEEALENIQI